MTAASILVLTHDVAGVPLLPHLGHLRASHPGTAIHVVSDASPGRREAWRNGDRKLRDWWRCHADEVAGDVLAVLEWDVLATACVPDLPAGLDLAGKDLKTPTGSPGWMWFREAARLEGLVPVGLAPFAVMVLRRAVLDELAATRWDALFARDVFCELRLPSIASAGFTVGEIDLPEVRWDETAAGRKPGIYHAVKRAL